MKTEKIKELIENSDMVKMQKNIAINFINKAEDAENKKQEDIRLIEQVANEKKLSKILFSSDEVKIYSVYGKDEWDINYPVRSIFINKKGIWEKNSTVSPNFETAFLAFLEKKYLGDNSDFTFFVLKMLGIEIEEH